MAICCCPYNKHKWEVGQFSSDESFWMCPALSRNSTCIRWGDLSRRQRTQSFFLLLGIVMVVYSLLQDFQTSVGIKLKWGIVERAPSKNFQFSRLLMCLRNLLSWLPRCFRCRWSEDYPLRKKTLVRLGRANSPVESSCPIHRPFLSMMVCFRKVETKKPVLLYFEPTLYLITCVNCSLQHCMAGCVNSI